LLKYGKHDFADDICNIASLASLASVTFYGLLRHNTTLNHRYHIGLTIMQFQKIIRIIGTPTEGRSIGGHRHQPKKLPITTRRGEGG
jgi:hypothetical protein